MEADRAQAASDQVHGTDLGTSLAGIALEHPFMNGAGTCKTIEDVRRFARSTVSAVTAGSITIRARPFNPGNTFWSSAHYALNSLGMPNPGRDYYREHLAEMVDICHDNGKAFILNVAGFSPEEYGVLADLAYNGGADLIELNLGCPNVWHDGRQARIPSFDPGAIVEILHAVERRVPIGRARIGVKLSPYSDPTLLEHVAEAIRELPVTYIASCNTFPNSYAIDDRGGPVVTVGYAGLSGEVMKPIAQGQVRQLRQRLGRAVQLVALGGVLTGQDIADYLHPDIGADAVAATTVYWRGGESPAVYGDILAQYVEGLRGLDGN